MKTYGLIGYPLSHSFSEKYFTDKFKRENISDSEYKTFPLKDISEFKNLIQNQPNLRGLSVTIPYKEFIISFLDELDETAKTVRAVNTIKISYNSQSHIPYLKGYNTDVYGFRESLKPLLNLNHERALILGSGGASKAVAFVLKQIGLSCLIVSRSEKPLTSNDHYCNYITYQELNKNVMDTHGLIVNTSPVGMYPNTAECPAIPYEYISNKHLLYDLTYNPGETLFLKKGKDNGAQIQNGLTMLHMQAERAWEIWGEE